METSGSSVLLGSEAEGDVAGYRLLDAVGDGERSRVWSAVELSTGRTVALKFFEPELRGDRGPEQVDKALARMRERFEREAAIAARFVGVPGLLQVYGSRTTEQGQLFLVMELLDARLGWESLEDRLWACEQLPEAEVLRIAAQMASALGALHRAGVEHRDLKPSNLMVRGYDEQVEVKLLDYGIALDRSLPRLTQQGEVPATLHYLSPAALRGQPDPERDVYALGVVLFEALTGQLPHEGASLPELLAVKLARPPTRVSALRPSLPARLAALVDDLVQQRIGCVGALAERLSLVLGEAALRAG